MNTSKEQSIILKEILQEAIKRIGKCGSAEYFMCNTIRNAAFILEYDADTAIEEAIKIGFTRENYHKFVQEHFSNLQVYLDKEQSYWLSVMAALRDNLLKEVIKSKKEFLQSLEDQL